MLEVEGELTVDGVKQSATLAEGQAGAVDDGLQERIRSAGGLHGLDGGADAGDGDTGSGEVTKLAELCKLFKGEFGG